MPTLPPKVSCLMATYGRHKLVCQAVTCFLDQDYPDKELVILNNHPVPLVAGDELRQVRIINEPGHATLGVCRNRLLDFADGELMRIWDDDDLYLPWAISQGVKGIGEEARAFKPARSWWSRGSDNLFELAGNFFEASYTWRTVVVKCIGHGKGAGDENLQLCEAVKDDLLMTEFGWHTSYCYMFGWPQQHGCHIGTSIDAPGWTVETRTARWMQCNQDHGNGVPLHRVDLSRWWGRIMEAIPDDPGRREHWLRGFTRAAVKPPVPRAASLRD